MAVGVEVADVGVEADDVAGGVDLVGEEDISEREERVDGVCGGVFDSAVEGEVVGFEERWECGEVDGGGLSLVAAHFGDGGGGGEEVEGLFEAIRCGVEGFFFVRGLRVFVGEVSRGAEEEGAHISDFAGDNGFTEAEGEIRVFGGEDLNFSERSVCGDFGLQATFVSSVSREEGNINVVVQNDVQGRRGDGAMAEDDDLVYFDKGNIKDGCEVLVFVWGDDFESLAFAFKEGAVLKDVEGTHFYGFWLEGFPREREMMYS